MSGPRQVFRLAEGAITPEELEAADELLPVEATEAHLLWLEGGAEGPDPAEAFLTSPPSRS